MRFPLEPRSMTLDYLELL